MSFSPDELERYARHIVLREIGGPGQQKLKRSHVTVIGAGGLGSPALLYLAAAGVGALRIIDDDDVSLSNLQRQVLHDTAQVGQPKTESAARALQRVNPHVQVETHAQRITSGNAGALLADTDLVLDGTDTYATRALVNATCVELKRPLLSGAISQWEGQLTLFYPAAGTACFTCLFPQEPADGQAPDCAEAGVMGALAGTLGAMMAGEAIKWITGAGQPLTGTMLIHDALWGETRRIRINRNPNCEVCGT
ncbi:MAG: HesA/MoeB/ThiF family protein [Pseudomonadota bacterium]